MRKININSTRIGDQIEGFFVGLCDYLKIGFNL
jgi:hypothetical protein